MGKGMAAAKLQAGVIGLGIGQHHLASYISNPHCEAVAIADTDEERLTRIGDKHGIAKRYTDATKMLRDEQLDLVSIATPNKFHKPLALAAFRAGCHVLCEKPMAMNAEEGQAMLDAASQAGKRLMINFSFRFREQSFALKKAVESGRLGDIYFGRTIWLRRRGMPKFGGWFSSKELSGGGPLIDLGVHRLDLALWLMGYPAPTYVMGRTWDPIATRIAKDQGKHYDVEDFAAAMIQFENGAMLELEASWAGNIEKREEMETRLLGTRAGLVQRNVGEGYDFEATLHVEQDGCQYDMALHPPVPAVENAFDHFVNAITEGRPHMATGEEGLTVMKILDAIYESAKQGKPIAIPTP